MLADIQRQELRDVIVDVLSEFQGHGKGFDADMVDGKHAVELIAMGRGSGGGGGGVDLSEYLKISSPPRITVFGGTLCSQTVWRRLYVVGDWAVECYGVAVPEGKSFKLWALGQMYCANSAATNLGVDISGSGGPLPENQLGLGELFKDFSSDPPTIGGSPLYLYGYYAGPEPSAKVNGYMVFSIE